MRTTWIMEESVDVRIEEQVINIINYLPFQATRWLAPPSK